MYQIYLLIGIFIGLIIYQILNFYSIKEGATPDQSMNAIPFYVNSSGQSIGDPNIDAGYSPLGGTLTNWFNENIPVGKYNALFKANNYRYIDLKGKYEVIFNPLFFVNNVFDNVKFNKFIQLDNDILNWVMSKDSNFINIINANNIDKFVSLTNAQIRLLIFGTNDSQIVAIINQPLQMILQILSLASSDRTLLLRLTGPQMTTIFNMPKKYILGSYLLYSNTPSNVNMTPILESINKNRELLAACDLNVANYTADNNVVNNNLTTCNLTKSSEAGIVQIADQTIQKQKQILGIN